MSRYPALGVRRFIHLLSCIPIDHIVADSTVISSKVGAHVSLRIVPDQDLETIEASVREHFDKEFKQMQSPNVLKVNGLLYVATHLGR